MRAKDLELMERYGVTARGRPMIPNGDAPRRLIELDLAEVERRLLAREASDGNKAGS